MCRIVKRSTVTRYSKYCHILETVTSNLGVPSTIIRSASYYEPVEKL